ncbi:HlyD family type I secretion periplasmic adaptor subunit [Hyphococcus flavus]|uniref:Membrane fusion protein (MFP) family protein n=1 Tax=Hyphococcus flavus TaxID=1866326 RepID=A0AAE9ZGF1_9PROT|nr:HlyD family type I secretion periplasmic adaptor subunit [Hyphococcus flavus]WDI32493.1 HlyD family type I secretion periplasmic adaptor subunit [Hyphococcus flavus]
MSDNGQLVSADENIDDALPIEPAKAAQYLLYVVTGVVVLTLVWASIAKLDRVTRGQGWVVTSNQLQELQYLEGGIVKEILVSAGDKVAAGELLVRLDPTQMNVAFAQGQDEFNVLAARIARLEAEAAFEAVTFPPELTAAAANIVRNERQLYQARQEELAASLGVEQNKLDQRRKGLEDARVSLETATEAFTLAAEEHSIMRRLVGKGIEPQVELLRARQREAAAKGEVQRAEIAIGRLEFEIAEAEGEVDRIRKTFMASAATDLTKAKAEFEELKGELPALQDKVTRTDVRAPVAGVINRVLVSTIGGVVSPGETIVELVPSEDTLLVEAKIKPADIGFLRVGQDANVSITAYDSSLYGSLDGVIETISPDAIEEEKTGERFYNIKVRTKAESLNSKRGDLKILPGMAAEVAILNGKRTVLAYIIKPMADINQKALRDK